MRAFDENGLLGHCVLAGGRADGWRDGGSRPLGGHALVGAALLLLDVMHGAPPWEALPSGGTHLWIEGLRQVAPMSNLAGRCLDFEFLESLRELVHFGFDLLHCLFPTRLPCLVVVRFAVLFVLVGRPEA